MSGITFFFDRKDTQYEPDSVRLFASTPVTLPGARFSVRFFELPTKPRLSLAPPAITPQIPEQYDLSSTILLEDAVSHDLSASLEIAINGVRIDRSLVSFDFAYGVGKEAAGKVVLQANNNVGPASVAIGMGVEVTINGKQKYSGFVIKNPSVTNSGGVAMISLEIGSQAQLRQAQNDKSLYCGLPPKNTRELAQIMSGQFGFEMDATPDGHDFEEVLEDQGFQGIKALVDAYAVTNHDVYENNHCRVHVLPRGRETDFYELDMSDIINVEWKPADGNDTRSAIVLNKYTKNHGYPVEITKTEKYSDNYNANNNLPWFKGGWTYTETFTHTKGATVVKIVSNTYGHIPTSWPFVDDNSIDQCVIVSPVPTAYGLITTEEILNFYEPLYMDRQALWKTEKRLSGLSVFRQEVPGPTVTIQWQLVQGAIARDITLYKNELVVDPTVLVCPHMQQWYQTYIRRWTFETLGNGGYSLSHYEEDHYQYQQIDSAATNFTVGRTNWVHSGSRAKINEVNGGWIKVPVEERGVDAAPSTVFLQPRQEEIRVEGLYIGEGEEFTGLVPDATPYCNLTAGSVEIPISPGMVGVNKGTQIQTSGSQWGTGWNNFTISSDPGGALILGTRPGAPSLVVGNTYSVLVESDQLYYPPYGRTWGSKRQSIPIVTSLNPAGVTSIGCRFLFKQGQTYFRSSSAGYTATSGTPSVPFNPSLPSTVAFEFDFRYNGGTGTLCQLRPYTFGFITRDPGVFNQTTSPVQSLVQLSVRRSQITPFNPLNMVTNRFFQGPTSYAYRTFNYNYSGVLNVEWDGEVGSTVVITQSGWVTVHSGARLDTGKQTGYMWLSHGGVKYYTGGMLLVDRLPDMTSPFFHSDSLVPCYSLTTNGFIGYAQIPKNVPLKLGVTIEASDFNTTGGNISSEISFFDYFWSYV